MKEDDLMAQWRIRARRPLAAVFSLALLAACAAPDAGSSPSEPVTEPLGTASQGPSAAASASAEVIDPVELTGSSFSAPESVQISVLLDDWATALSDATGGQVTSEITYGGALFPGPESLEGVSSGIADFASTTPGYHPGELPLSQFLVIFEIGSGVDERGGMLIALKLFEEFPELEAEWEAQGLKPVTFMIFDPYYFISTQEITNLEDLEGLRTSAVGQFSPRLVEAIGMTGVNMPTAETYTGLSTGTIDATFTCGDCQVAGKTYEVASHSLGVGPVLSLPVVIGFMSLDKFESLPESVQETIDELRYTTSYDGVQRMVDRSAEVREVLEENTTLTDMSEEDLAAWKEAAPDFRAEWAESIDAMELPGTAIYERYQELVEEYANGELEPWWDD